MNMKKVLLWTLIIIVTIVIGLISGYSVAEHYEPTPIIQFEP